MKRRDFITGGLAMTATVGRSTRVQGNSMSDTEPMSDAVRAEFLHDLQSRCYRYFVEAADPGTGLISDRASVDGSWYSTHASSAACGFGLAAHAMAPELGLATRAESLDRSRLILRSLVDLVEHEQGFLYHFFDRRNGVRAMDCEASSIDTAILIAGAMTAATKFADDAEVAALSDTLYRRVNWRFMLGANDLMFMGWSPEKGMLPYQWDTYSELILLVLIAIGAPENPIPARCWNAWRREPVLDFQGQGFMSYPPLFVHQYPMAFFDFKKYVSPSGRSYWNNAVIAHHAQIEFMTELGRRQPDRFGHYGSNMWGLTSSDSAEGYRDWGGPYQVGRYEPDRGIDGSVVPSAAAGGLPMVPDEAIRTLSYQRETFGDMVYGRYGYVNVFNPATNWAGRDCIGIDTGISFLQAENLRSGGVWDSFMGHPAATRGLLAAGFRAV